MAIATRRVVCCLDTSLPIGLYPVVAQIGCRSSADDPGGYRRLHIGHAYGDRELQELSPHGGSKSTALAFAALDADEAPLFSVHEVSAGCRLLCRRDGDILAPCVLEVPSSLDQWCEDALMDIFGDRKVVEGLMALLKDGKAGFIQIDPEMWFGLEGVHARTRRYCTSRFVRRGRGRQTQVSAAAFSGDCAVWDDYFQVCGNYVATSGVSQQQVWMDICQAICKRMCEEGV